MIIPISRVWPRVGEWNGSGIFVVLARRAAYSPLTAVPDTHLENRNTIGAAASAGVSVRRAIGMTENEDLMFERDTTISTMSAQVARIIGMRIVSGEFSPGDALPIESELCRVYGVSRSTIREAVKNLSAKRLVEVAPKVGTRVRPFADWNLLDPDVLDWRLSSQFDHRIVEDLYEMRFCFEPRACQLAVREGSQEDIALISQKFKDLTNTLSDPALAANAEVEFHLAIIAATHNGLFVAIGGAVKTALRASFAAMQHLQPAARGDLSLYEAVLNAIVERKEEEAFEHMSDLLHHSRRKLLQRLVRSVPADRSQQVTSP